MRGVAREGKQGQEWMLPEDMETVYFKTFFGGVGCERRSRTGRGNIGRKNYCAYLFVLVFAFDLSMRGLFPCHWEGTCREGR